MPIYEYRCRDCGKRTARLLLSINNPPSISCRHCQSTKVDRVLSRFASPKSEEARLERLADPSNFGDVDENDPQSMARFMKRMGQEMGEDLGDDFEEAIDGSEGGLSESDSTDL